jgi:FimV-like protein
MGQQKNAEKILHELSDNGNGAAKRQARRLLKSLENNKNIVD